MQQSKAKAIKGLSIACIVLSGLCMLCFLLGIIVCSVLADYSGPIMAAAYEDIYDSSYGLGSGHHYSYGSPYSYGDSYSSLSPYESAELLAFTLQFMNVFLALGFLMQAFSLVGAIIMLRTCNNPERYGVAFGWGLAGAILSFLSGCLVQMALFIIAIVFIRKDYNLYKAGQYPGSVTATAQYGAPAQPVQPVQPIQPMQPAAPVAPVAPVQPVQQAQPTGATDIYPNAQTYQSAPQTTPAAAAQATPQLEQPSVVAVSETTVVESSTGEVVQVEEVEVVSEVPADESASGENK